MTYRCLVTAFFIFLLSFSLSNAFAEDLVSAEQLPAWFAESLQDEKNVTLRSYLKINELDISKKVMGELEIAPAGENGWFIVNDIGTASPLDCYVLTDFDGPATSLYNVVEYGLQDAAQFNDKPLTGMRTFSVAHGLLSEVPFIALDTLYNLGEGEQMVTGILKSMSAPVGDNLLICMHNEIGFRNTFKTVFQTLVEALKTGITVKPFFRTIAEASINGKPVGYSLEAYYVDEFGDVRKERQTSMLTPNGPVALLRSDTGSYSWSDADGWLINASEYKVANGKLNYWLDIEATDSSWSLSGTLGDGDVSETLDYEGHILSEYGSHLVTFKQSQNGFNDRTYKMWLADQNPGDVSDVTMKAAEPEQDADFTVVTQGMTMLNKIDNTGVIKQSSATTIFGTIELKRVFLDGSPVIEQ